MRQPEMDTILLLLRTEELAAHCRHVGYGLARPSETIEYDVSSLKEEEQDHDDFEWAIISPCCKTRVAVCRGSMTGG